MNKWQRIYNWIHGWQPPKSVKALINLAGTILMRFPNIALIVMKAYELSSWVKDEDMTGLMKKEQVTKRITDLADTFDITLPAVVVNFINELCAVSVKFLEEGRE